MLQSQRSPEERKTHESVKTWYSLSSCYNFSCPRFIFDAANPEGEGSGMGGWRKKDNVQAGSDRGGGGCIKPGKGKISVLLGGVSQS